MISISRWRILIVALVAVLSRSSREAAARKSEEKCREYAALVYEEVDAPVLRIGAGSNTVSGCTIVETPLIVGGVKAKPAEMPHMAVIGFGRSDDDVSWQCGGSIISDIYILTAAHCMESRDKAKARKTRQTLSRPLRMNIYDDKTVLLHSRGPARKVRVGMNNILNPEESMQERKVVDGIKHPDYKVPIRYHDIALLKLDEPLMLNPRVRPACLEVQAQPPGKTAIASGFGKTSYAARAGSDDLMKVQLNYISEDECRKSFGPDIGDRHMPQGLIENMLCAGIMEGGKDTCQGDSGGPLQRVLAEPYCMYSIVGITSFGRFCAFKNSPAVYSRVSSYLDWIESVVWP